MPRRIDEIGKEQIMPDAPGYPVLLDEPVRPGPAPEEGPGGPFPDMPDEMAAPPMPPEGMQAEGGEEGQLPTSAAVMEVTGEHVVIIDDTGEQRRIPLDAFPIEPREGMLLERAMVVEVGDGKIFVRVGEERGVIEISKHRLQRDFEVGDFFWMPEPPKPPEGVEELEPDEEEE